MEDFPDIGARPSVSAAPPSGGPAGGLRPAAVAAWLAIAALYLAVRLPLLAVPLERDEGAFGAVAQALRGGAALYGEVIDHKPPGVYLLYAAALTLVPPTAVGIHAALLVWNAATLLLLASLAGRLGGAAAARWTALVFVLLSAAPSLQGYSASTEMLLLLPLVAAWRLAMAADTAAGPRRVALLAASGALGAAACWIKPPALLPLLIVPLWLARGAGARSSWRRRAGDGALWLAGGALLSLAVALPIVARAGLAESWYWMVTHNRLYSGEPLGIWMERAHLRWLELRWDLAVPLALAVCGTLLGALRRQPLVWAAPLFLLLSLAAAFHSPFLYRHYVTVLAPALALAAGLGTAWLQAALPGRAARLAFAAAALAALLAAPLSAAPWYWLRPDPVAVALRQFGPQGFESAALVAAHLRDTTAAGDTLFIYGSEPQIAFLAERRQASAFATVYPLTRAFPRHRELQERAWREVAAAPPARLIVARMPTSFFRSPDMDLFLQQRLTELAAGYEFDAALVYDAADQPARLTTDRPYAGTVVLEVWRRR